ncbi:uncharacterized protein LOC117105303 [Anneissia japonica]|uniref:uncharacterized protein LOC117105303 n=1 Tax=Anneissia japonica TaxID=1529436 RepID=UPI001425994B|nr:uncharacterized protein LOC117105303 [Anneissia japonica]
MEKEPNSPQTSLSPEEPPPCSTQTDPYEAAYNMQPATVTTVVRTQPNNYLCLAIFVTLCCCFTFGIIGIVCSQASSHKFSHGDDVGAKEYAICAKVWSIAGLFIGVAVIAFVSISVVYYIKHSKIHPTSIPTSITPTQLVSNGPFR